MRSRTRWYSRMENTSTWYRYCRASDLSVILRGGGGLPRLGRYKRVQCATTGGIGSATEATIGQCDDRNWGASHTEWISANTAGVGARWVFAG